MSTVGRYLVAHYLRAFGLCLASATGLFLVIDFFNQADKFVEYRPAASSVAAYFLFKLPRVITEIYPAAALLAVLASMGLLSRHREILALRACGMSTLRLAMPLLVASAVTSTGVLVWNETVVPPATARSRLINDVVIKKKDRHGRFDARGLWLYGRQGFVSVDHFDAAEKVLHGLTLYEADPSFRLNRIIDVPMARWSNGAWQISGGDVKNLGPDGEVLVRPLEAGELELAETPDEFSRRRRSPSEFSYRDLEDQVEVIRSKGLDPSELLVDLYAKLAWPFSGLVTVFVGFPLAVRGGLRWGVSHNLGVGMLIGFAYWATVAVSSAAGHSAILPPLAAAWMANALFTALGAWLYWGYER